MTSDQQQPSSRARRIPPERLAVIEAKLLKAEAPADFVPTLAKEWGRSKRRVWDYVARVRASLAARAKSAKLDPDADAELVRGLLLEAYRTARTGTEKGPDAKGMVAAAKALGEVTGAMGPRRIEITGKDGGPITTVDARTALTGALAGIAPQPDARGASEPDRNADGGAGQRAPR